MSKISDIIDQIIVVMETVLPTYQRIANPYIVDENSELILEKGFAIAFGPGSNGERNVSCRMDIDRGFIVSLVNLIGATESDVEGWDTYQKDIAEDAFLVVKALEKNSDLNATAASFKFVDDGGLEFLDGDRTKYFLLEMSFLATYLENLT